jgi:carbamate kinase
MRIVLGLGGNALLLRNEAPEAETQKRNVEKAVVAAVAPLARRHPLVLTHRNGPQIGLLALQSASYRTTRPYPLDLLGAESQGMIGYLIDLALANALPDRQIATLLTEVEVDPQDPVFAAPKKPIGPFYSHSEAGDIAAERGWKMMRAGRRMGRRARAAGRDARESTPTRLSPARLSGRPSAGRTSR